MSLECMMALAIYLLVWLHGITAVDPIGISPLASSINEPRKRGDSNLGGVQDASLQWICPNVSGFNEVSCGCDAPHTVRCKGRIFKSSLLTNLTTKLYQVSVPGGQISLLDLAIHDLKELPPASFTRLNLLGLIISSGEINKLSTEAFEGLEDSLGALGLPSNDLKKVPSQALKNLIHLHSLDMSDNAIKILRSRQFEGLSQLQDLNLAGNGIVLVERDAFNSLKRLQHLNLSRNKLTFSILEERSLNKLPLLEQLSLQSNLFNGSLKFEFLTSWPRIKRLDISHNLITKVSFGSPSENVPLESLDLSYNQIDIVEDHAFRNLSSLRVLDLSHNRIVAVSGWSLAHLPKLVDLSVADNSLFAVTADLLHQLPNLRNLDLAANDISLLQPDVFNYTPKLTEFDFSDNPLNCDCSLSWLWSWLTRHSFLDREDKSSVVCATPPTLENAPMIELNSSDLTCEERNPDYYHDGTTRDYEEGYELRISDAEISLEGAKWVDDDVQLLWRIDERAVPYTCQAIHIYELETFNNTEHQSLAVKSLVNCTSEGRPNPQEVVVTVPTSELKPGNTYRYCLVLLEHGTGDRQGFLPGCSEALKLSNPPKKALVHDKITSIIAGTMGLHLVSQTRIHSVESSCSYSLFLILGNNVVQSQTLNCSEIRHSFSNLSPGEYRICARLESEQSLTHADIKQLLSEQEEDSALLSSVFAACTSAVLQEEAPRTAPLLLLLFTIPGLALIITLYLIGRRVWKGGGVPWKWDPRARKRAKYFLYTGEAASPAPSLDPLPSVGSDSPESTTRV